MRAHKPAASELMVSGWLPPNAAADAMGITVRVLLARAKKREVRRREVVPGTGIFLYECEVRR